MTKVEAIVRVMQDNGGQATLQEIYENISTYYKEARTSKEWSAGIRGVLYREIRNGKTFKKVGEATYALVVNDCAIPGCLGAAYPSGYCKRHSGHH